ncbi:MAG: exosortase system-associated protein, TIGR04073 family [Methyloprofundus sp.]|nr:exosortase system-associated protein, TIGR04073 family [Methyloprofundus sp.]MDT8425158.1 exosortase system-associated protein, TIGR04073 family [Methyloprofundus sp.]
MKFNKTILLALLASTFLSFSSLSIAEESYGEKIGDKALRGLTNFSLSFLEIPKNMIIVTNDTNLIYGLTGGIGLGVLNTLGRLSIGTLDLITFPLPTKPIVQPIHPWNNYLEVNTAYGDLFATDF